MTEPEALRLGPNGWVPNNSMPVLIYRGMVPIDDPSAIECTLRTNNGFPDWRNSLYQYDHYHSTAT